LKIRGVMTLADFYSPRPSVPGPTTNTALYTISLRRAVKTVDTCTAQYVLVEIGWNSNSRMISIFITPGFRPVNPGSPKHPGWHVRIKNGFRGGKSSWNPDLDSPVLT
jgi:hypothetical protein